MTPPTVFIADEHRVLVEGLRRLLEPEFRVVGSSDGGRELVEQVAGCRPDVVLIDISMPQLNGIDAVGLLRKRGCRSKLVMLTMHADAEFVSEALRAGANGYLLKLCDPEEILTGLREVLLGRRYVAAQLAEGMFEAHAGRLQDTLPEVRLTEREREVLQLLAEGMRVKEAAAVLNVSPRTIEFHRYNMAKKLGVKTVAELTRYAVKRGLIAP
jgi:DNA-binding NarL/FixJ family response regulator